MIQIYKLVYKNKNPSIAYLQCFLETEFLHPDGVLCFAGVEEVFLLPRLWFLEEQRPEELHPAAFHPTGGEHREDVELRPLWDTGRHPP